MPAPRRKIGDIGEEVAWRYLRRNGYVLLEKNYLKPWGEIDIIAKKGGGLRFIEVKSISRGTIRPEENMHPAKLKKLYKAIQTYLSDNKVSEKVEWQIDLVCVFLDFSSKKARVKLMENIVL